jgi:hypothetical protein
VGLREVTAAVREVARALALAADAIEAGMVRSPVGGRLLAAAVWFRSGPGPVCRGVEEVGIVRQAASELADRSPSTAAAGARPTRAAVTW